MSRTILWLKLKEFYVSQHNCGSKPLMVMRDGKVLDANALARKRRVRPGMSERHARAIIHDGLFKTWQEEDYRERQKAWLNCCLHLTGIIEPEDQHSVYLDLSQHPQTIDLAENAVRFVSSKSGLTVVSGMASSKWLARLAGEHSDYGLAMRDPAAFLAPLKISYFSPVSMEVRSRLRFLGYRTIGDVAGIPLETLKDQFGDEGLIVYKAARGLLTQDVQPLYPPDSLVEPLIFESPVESAETLDLAYKTLASRIGERLGSRGMEGSDVQAAVLFEDGTKKLFRRTFSKPLRCSRSAYSALKLLVQFSFDRPIEAVWIRVNELKRVRSFQKAMPTGHGLQATGYEEVDRYVRADAALAKVRTAFGDMAVVRGDEVETPRRVMVLREWGRAYGWH